MQNFKAKYVFQGLLFASLFLILSVYVGKLIPWNSDFLEGFYLTAVGLAFVGIVIHTLWDVDVRSQAEYEGLLSKRFLPVRMPGKVTFLVILVILCHRLWLGGGEMKSIYNTNVEYSNSYVQTSQKITSMFDYYYTTKTEKTEILSMNREDFFAITKLIFDARKDGEKVAWKLLFENQNVPYSEFTKFYSDLSVFVEANRSKIMELENQKQAIVKEQNSMIQVFPNNIYNWFLGIKPMEYSATAF